MHHGLQQNCYTARQRISGEVLSSATCSRPACVPALVQTHPRVTYGGFPDGLESCDLRTSLADHESYQEDGEGQADGRRIQDLPTAVSSKLQRKLAKGP